MAFFGLFKSKFARDQEARKEEAKLVRAFDTGRRISQTVIPLIDQFYDEKVIPVVRDIVQAYDKAMEGHHHDASTEDAMNLLVSFKTQREELKERAVQGVWDHLGEWKYALIEAGVKEDFDYYIAKKFDPVWEVMDTKATEQMAYCAARISGHITDEMHAMTPDELEAFLRRREQK